MYELPDGSVQMYLRDPAGQPRRARLARRDDARPLAVPRDQEARTTGAADRRRAAGDALPRKAAVKPAPFAYHAPTTVEEAVARCSTGSRRTRCSPAARASSADEVPPAKPTRARRRQRRRRPRRDRGARRRAHVGAARAPAGAARGRARSRAAPPLLREAARYVGYLATRHRGTVGGSLAYAAPWAELPAAAVALDATIDVRSARGDRARSRRGTSSAARTRPRSRPAS